MSKVKEAVEMTNTANISARIMNSPTKKYEPVPLDDTENWDSTLKIEIVMWRDYEISVNELSDNYIKKNFRSIVGDGNYVKGLYYVDEQNIAQKKYLYDEEYDTLYKIPQTRIGLHIVHSIEELNYIRNGGTRTKKKVDYTPIVQTVEIVEVSNTKCYEPDINNFAEEVTELVFYKVNKDGEGNITEVTYTEKPKTASWWLNNGKPNEFEEGNDTYVLYNYKQQIWANIRITTSGVETNWTWIPRYEYLNDNTNQTTTAVFIDTDNNKLNGEEGDFTIPEAFSGNQQKGMWISKYEPTPIATTNTSLYSYYIPDLTGFDKETTDIALYEVDDEGNPTEFGSFVKLSTINNLSTFAKENNWFDYNDRKWANIRVKKNGLETWWVWIPRYVYRNDGTSTEIIFVDTDNEPIDGTTHSDTYSIPEAFKGNTQRGIWVSKYEPTATNSEFTQDIYTAPDLTGFITNENKDNVEIYIETYNNDKSGFTNSPIKYTNGMNIDNIGNWYNYSEKLWANIKVVNTQGTETTSDDVETWWVWIPRYAYNNMLDKTDIVLLSKDNKIKSRDGNSWLDMPSYYSIAEPFVGNTKEGIWISKYEPIGDYTLPAGQ